MCYCYLNIRNWAHLDKQLVALILQPGYIMAEDKDATR